MQEAEHIDAGPQASVDRNGDKLVVHVSGAWHLKRDLPSPNLVKTALDIPPKPAAVVFDSSGLRAWDSGLLAFLAGASEACHRLGVQEDRSRLPTGLQRLLELAEAVPEKEGVAHTEHLKESVVERLGEVTEGFFGHTAAFVDFVGRLAIAMGKFVTGEARYRRSDLMVTIQDCGANALGIVTLISFLVGVILAFMGAVQLQQFGAAIFVADLVGIGMTRDMGAVMTAVIMSGRTGAAFAAQLGTMKVTQEIDALTTLGVSPVEFLVLPRTLALILMMPLLCLYADFMGILGGAAVGVLLHVSPITYFQETAHALRLSTVWGGVFKATVYGILIAIAGCLRGFQCGNSSSAVGDAATSAVVTSIVMVVVACGLFAVIFNILGI
jgi:phospholipid/cholesterol/gamma-HCH transport system permease protein